MLVKHVKKVIDTNGKQFTNLTSFVRDVLHNLGAGDGIVTVFSEHTTACVKILENEVLSLCDIDMHLDTFIPRENKKWKYMHDNIGLRDVPPDERVNGFAHVRSLYFNHSETIPVENGRLQLGLWQTLFLVDLDGPRNRTICVTFIGTKKEQQNDQRNFGDIEDSFQDA